MVMVAEDNKAIAHKLFDEVWNKGNVDVVDEYIATDYIEHFPGMKGGRDGFRETHTLFRTAFPDIQLTIDDEFAVGDRVVHRWTWRCTHRGELFGIPPTGKRVQFSGILILRMVNGQIAERWSQLDRLSLLQQLGAIPALPPVEG
jgi:steroid delta-isomerase-like uncharacterized protein